MATAPASHRKAAVQDMVTRLPIRPSTNGNGDGPTPAQTSE